MVVNGRCSGPGWKRDLFGIDEFFLSLYLMPALHTNNTSNNLILFFVQNECSKGKERGTGDFGVRNKQACVHHALTATEGQ